MSICKSVKFAAILGVTMMVGSSAQAEFVSFFTTGVFESTGTSTYSQDGVTINFIPSTDNSANVPPASSATFGTFDTTGTTAASLQSIMDTFILTIIPTEPGGIDPLEFRGTLSGSLSATNSQAFVQFSSPLTQVAFPFIFSIVQADDLMPGRVNLSPPSINNGLATIAGRVDAIPEPASFAMMAMGGTSLLALARRKRAAARSAA